MSTKRLQKQALRDAYKQKSKQRKPKKPDMRGKHTKESRAKKRLEEEIYRNSLNLTPSCANCTKTDFVLTYDLDSPVCTGCGCVSNDRNVVGACDPQQLVTRSLKYMHCHYWAERIRQFCNLEPRFTESEQDKICIVWNELHAKDPQTWSNSATSFSKYRFKQLLAVLDKVEPGKRWKQKLERWWQAREIIYGHDPTYAIGDEYTSHMLKVLFDPFARYFATQFKNSTSGQHNIPKTDLIFLLLLYNISPDHLRKHGWYFLNKNILAQKESIEADYARIEEICKAVNDNLRSKAKLSGVRRESYVWFGKNNYKVPPLSKLVKYACSSNEGKNVLKQLNYHGSYFDKKIVLEQ